MILPTKHIKVKQSLIGLGIVVLKNITSEGVNITTLWDNLKDNPDIFNYERFILTLDMLFIMGLVEFKNNKILMVTQ